MPQAQDYLIELGPAIAPALVPRLQEPDADVRAGVADVLGAIGDAVDARRSRPRRKDRDAPSPPPPSAPSPASRGEPPKRAAIAARGSRRRRA